MSAILSADDLNDFISPGVACIKPIESLPRKADKNSKVRIFSTHPSVSEIHKEIKKINFSTDMLFICSLVW